MYESQFDRMDETRFAKRSILWVVALLFAISIAAFVMTRSVGVADTAVIRYEEFQEIYNTCQKINTDLGIIRAVPESDRMFEAFSKSAVIAQKQQQLTRWVEEYNAKSDAALILHPCDIATLASARHGFLIVGPAGKL